MYILCSLFDRREFSRLGKKTGTKKEVGGGAKQSRVSPVGRVWSRAGTCHCIPTSPFWPSLHKFERRKKADCIPSVIICMRWLLSAGGLVFTQFPSLQAEWWVCFLYSVKNQGVQEWCFANTVRLRRTILGDSLRVIKKSLNWCWSHLNMATSWLFSDLKLEESETTFEFDRGALRFQTCRVLSADARTMACLWLEESETTSEFWREQFGVVGVLFVFLLFFTDFVLTRPNSTGLGIGCFWLLTAACPFWCSQGKQAVTGLMPV